LNFHTSSNAIHASGVSFYKNVGFIALRDTVYCQNEPAKTGETWLCWYGPNNKHVTIKLVLDDKNKPEQVPKPPADLRDSRVVFALISSEIKALEEIFKAEKYTYQNYEVRTGDSAIPSANHPPVTKLYVVDPMGNCLQFTNKSSPLSSNNKTFPLTSGVQPDLGKFAPVPPVEGGRKKKIGILTSGGDSQGMNAAVRSFARMAYVKGMEPYAVYDGYQGLVDNNMKKLGWSDVRGLLSLGGTVIGTARCAAFRTPEGRLQAAHNMIKNGIDALAVVGGDGSLTGADTFRREWTSLLQSLLKTNKITQDEAKTFQHLNIVGLVGSIDNDMSSTDWTIGCASALHRVIEAVDALESTALSHGRAFVVEVMGRHCGWLALMAAIACGADWLFVPERPMMVDDWESAMCAELSKLRDLGQRRLMIIVCEGAIDRNLKPIKAEYVREILAKQLRFDTRVTTLGHVQRGGSPCYFDRYLGTVQGVQAVEEILKATPESPSSMIGINNNEITTIDLMKAVELTHNVSAAIEKKDFARAMELRDPDFAPSYDGFVNITVPKQITSEGKAKGLRIGIMHIGAPAGGMNTATRIATLLALNKGHTPLAIYNGFAGLVNGDIKPLNWMDVHQWNARGGSELGTNRAQPTDLGLVAYQLQNHNIQSLIIIGGFEAYTSIYTLYNNRKQYPAFCIPMVHIPATISNNVPGSDYSLGSDTALNVIVDACDKIKQSASSSRKRVFVVEVHGGNVGYLATMGGLAGGATSTYIPEEGITLDLLKKDVDLLIRRYKDEGAVREGRVILRNEWVSPTYTTQIVCDILKAEGKGLFDSRTASLGHLQQGGAPSPIDRIRAVRFATLALNWIEKQASLVEEVPHTPVTSPVDEVSHKLTSAGRPPIYTLSKETACVLGIRAAKFVFTPVVDLLAETDTEKRRSINAWWMDYRPLVHTLSKYTLAEESTQSQESSSTKENVY